MNAGKAGLSKEHLAKDARKFGRQVAKAVLTELEGDASEEKLEGIRSVFLQAIDYIEKRYGSESATMWQDEANREIQQHFAVLKPSQTNGSGEGEVQ